MRRAAAMDLQCVDRPAVTTMTRPVSGGRPALPTPAPRLSRPILPSGARTSRESELRGVSGTTAVKSVCYVRVVGDSASSSISVSGTGWPSCLTEHERAVAVHRTPRLRRAPTTQHSYTHTNHVRIDCSSSSSSTASIISFIDDRSQCAQDKRDPTERYNSAVAL